MENPDVTAEVERRVLERAADKTAKELGRYARDVVKTLDPALDRRWHRAKTLHGVRIALADE